MATVGIKGLNRQVNFLEYAESNLLNGRCSN